jgi:hypothetical protein
MESTLRVMTRSLVLPLMEEQKMKKYEHSIKIEGKTWDEIAYNYLGYFSEGWTLTIDDLAGYLRCHYNYILHNVSQNVPHIYINRAANKALYRYFQDPLGGSVYEGHDEFFPLITKKYLFHPDTVEEYFLKNMTLVTEKLVKDKKTKKEIKKITKSKLEEFPPQLLSAKDFIENGIFDYDVQLRRFVLNHGVPKVIYKNLVRYRREDFSIIPLEFAGSDTFAGTTLEEGRKKPDE